MKVVCVELAVDIPLSGAVLRILQLMALADGVVAPEEEAMLEKICNQYFGKMDVSSWDQVFQDPSDLKQVAAEVAISDRPLTAQLAYMVLSACREAYSFPVNTAERRIFDQLTECLELSDDQINEAILAATREMSREPGFWEILFASFSNSLAMNITPDHL